MNQSYAMHDSVPAGRMRAAGRSHFGATPTDPGIWIERNVPLPNKERVSPFIANLNKLREGGSFLATTAEAVAFREKARRYGCQVAFRTTNKSAGRPMEVWMARG